MQHSLSLPQKVGFHDPRWQLSNMSLGIKSVSKMLHRDSNTDEHYMVFYMTIDETQDDATLELKLDGTKYIFTYANGLWTSSYWGDQYLQVAEKHKNNNNNNNIL
jgi:hypothetical protein